MLKLPIRGSYPWQLLTIPTHINNGITGQIRLKNTANKNGPPPARLASRTPAAVERTGRVAARRVAIEDGGGGRQRSCTG